MDGSLMSIDVAKCCSTKLETSPVSSDLPRLARRFVLQKYDGGEFVVLSFCKDIKKDSLELVVHGLLDSLYQLLKPSSKDIQQVPYNTFEKEVNLQFVDSISQYLIKHYGETAPLNRMLKACSQGVVIAVLGHIRSALSKNNISVKDVKGEWYIFVHTNQENKPVVRQRRKEQVFRFSKDGGIELLYKFEWEIEVVFDSLDINEVVQVTFRLVGLTFDTPLISPQEQEEIKEIFNTSLKDCTVSTHIALEEAK